MPRAGFQFELPAGRPRSDAGRGRADRPRVFARRIEAAWRTRQALGLADSCRVVFGESDGLPGLTVDKFADCLSFQIACLGLEQWKPELVSILAERFTPRGIYERDDLPVREKEGLPLIKTCVYGEVPEELVIREHDARMLVSIANGQKTGHFLDQQENRGRLKPYAPGQDVLDLCCCTGGFSIHAALYGAKSVEAVDVSEDALALVRRNAALNGCRISSRPPAPTSLTSRGSTCARDGSTALSSATRPRLPRAARRWKTRTGAIKNSTCSA